MDGFDVAIYGLAIHHGIGPSSPSESDEPSCLQLGDDVVWRVVAVSAVLANQRLQLQVPWHRFGLLAFYEYQVTVGNQTLGDARQHPMPVEPVKRLRRNDG